MENQKILIYGPAKTGKSVFVKKVNGVEKNKTDYSVPESFPTIYVYNEKPDDAIQYDIILHFTQAGVTFEKGFKLNSDQVNSKICQHKVTFEDLPKE